MPLILRSRNKTKNKNTSASSIPLFMPPTHSFSKYLWKLQNTDKTQFPAFAFRKGIISQKTKKNTCSQLQIMCRVKTEKTTKCYRIREEEATEFARRSLGGASGQRWGRWCSAEASEMWKDCFWSWAKLHCSLNKLPKAWKTVLEWRNRNSWFTGCRDDGLSPESCLKTEVASFRLCHCPDRLSATHLRNVWLNVFLCLDF